VTERVKSLFAKAVSGAQSSAGCSAHHFGKQCSSKKNKKSRKLAISMSKKSSPHVLFHISKPSA
jgi:hypothetical protein